MNSDSEKEEITFVGADGVLSQGVQNMQVTETPKNQSKMPDWSKFSDSDEVIADMVSLYIVLKSAQVV